MKITDVLSRSELQHFLRRSYLMGMGDFLVTWGLIAGAFALAGFFPNVLTVLVSLILLGNRQLALLILTHDACHHAILPNRRLNDLLGNWFAAHPVLMDLEGYRRYHLQHHRFTGLPYKGETGDPDHAITRNYPISPKSLAKWLLRDLTLRTGPRLYLGLAAMKLGYLKYDLSGRVTRLPRKKQVFFRGIYSGVTALLPFFLTNTAIFTTLYIAGIGWTYLLWVVAALSVQPLFIRVRAIAEHGMLPHTGDLLRNTRTTHAAWWERLTFAPCHVNYHLEHHLLMAAPSYRLAELHRLLAGRGILRHSPVASGYAEVLRLATRRKP